MAQPRDGRGAASGVGSSRKPSARPASSAPGTGRSQASAWLRGIHVSGFSIVMMSLLVLAVIVLAPALHEYLQQREQIADARQTVDNLRTKIAKMDAERARWSDPSYIRAEARERLYYVMPGDTSYLIIDDRPAAEKDAKPTLPSTKIESTPSDWSASLFGSFMIAGLTHQTASQLGKDGGASAPPQLSSTPAPTAGH